MRENLRKFQIQVWFETAPDKVLLGTVSVFAETEERALELAKSHTHYQVAGVDNVTWQVREAARAYQ